MSIIDNWEFPELEKCHFCNNLIVDHWRWRPCLMHEDEDEIELTPEQEKAIISAFYEEIIRDIYFNDGNGILTVSPDDTDEDIIEQVKRKNWNGGEIECPIGMLRPGFKGQGWYQK